MVRGWQVSLVASSYATPSCCASCCGPRETEVAAKVSEKNGNVRTTLTMEFPYCNACARRARREKVRRPVVLTLAALLGVGLPLAAWAFDVVLEAPFRFAVAILAAIATAPLLALVTRPSQPRPPATARGEAVLLRDTTGTVLCTNQRFAELLAADNGSRAQPGSQWMTTEIWSAITATLMSALVLTAWIQVGAPSAGFDFGTSAPAATSQAGTPNGAAAPPKTTAAAKKPAPATHAAAAIRR